MSFYARKWPVREMIALAIAPSAAFASPTYEAHTLRDRLFESGVHSLKVAQSCLSPGGAWLDRQEPAAVPTAAPANEAQDLFYFSDRACWKARNNLALALSRAELAQAHATVNYSQIEDAELYITHPDLQAELAADYLQLTQTPFAELSARLSRVLALNHWGDLVEQEHARNGEDCALDFGPGELPLPAFSDHPPRTSTTDAIAILHALDGVLQSHAACAEKRAAILRLFSPVSRVSSVVTSRLDDLAGAAWIAWMSQNPARLIHSEALRQMIGASLELGLPLTRADHDRWVRSKFGRRADGGEYEHSAVLLKLAVQKELLTLIHERGGAGFADFARFSAAVQRDLVSAWLPRATRLVSDRAVREADAHAMRAECDQKLGQIFGDSQTLALGSGMDIRGAGSPEQNLELIERFHLFADMHLYGDARGTRPGPVFAPPGWSAAGPGGEAWQGSYVLRYPVLGNYRNVILNFNHLGDPERLLRFKDYPVEQNEWGSVRVGSTGGVGGEAGGEAGEGGYVHSHVQLWDATGKMRLNFVDAFCR